ncbi:STAS-like domain-containing protein [Paradesertivirga mongoliensis]|uniref:STAS-like domain-containing protein n=1 Tax=Paradesertivirga mongoliensis TaxID=2100740 RepID=A0ABW4ZL22_9SPHI|nr:STAS-like domain-containing protein [Pedobacter mongoliensis]
MERFKIEIAKDFNDKLGGRWIKLGPFSGELFYNEVLKEKYQSAMQENEKLHIYLDGTKGYGSSFLDQSFGELSREFGVEEVYKTLIFHSKYFSNSISYIVEEIWGKR